MKRYVRLTLVGAGALLLLLAAGITAAILLINPSDYKPRIEALALKATGKPLVIEGDLSLSVFPGISIDIGTAELRDGSSFGPGPFLRLEKASASVAFFPLLTGKVQIGDVSVSGVRLKLAVDGQGKANWRFPATGKDGQAEEKPATQSSPVPEPDLPSISLSSLQVRDVLVTYTDLRSGESTELAVPKLTLDGVRVGKKTVMGLEVKYTGAALPKPATLSMNAAFVLPASLASGTTLTLNGTLDDTDFSGTCLVAFPPGTNKSKIQASGEFTLGALNLDAYTAGNARAKMSAAGQKATPNNQTASSGEDNARSLLHRLFLDLRLSMQSLTVANIPVKDIALTVKADKGLVTVKPVTMVIADAPLTLEGSVDAREKTIRSRVTGNWKNAKIASIVTAVSGRELLTGTLNANWNIATTGLSGPEITNNLSGMAAFELLNGSLLGFPVIPDGIPGLPAMTKDLTIVKSSASWNIANGVARNDDLIANAVTLTASGSGQVNIPAGTVKYTLVLDLPPIPEMPQLKTLPVTISGPFSALKYEVDRAAVVRGAAKSLLDPETKTGRKMQRELGRALDGLFKR